jgi:ankyrin repeat protein
MKIGKLEIRKHKLKLLLLFCAAAAIIVLTYLGLNLFHNIREYYTYKYLMTSPRGKINLEILDSAFSHRPEWITKKDQYGWSAMHWSSIWCRKQAVEVMLKHGADINIRTTRGLTPLHLAMRLFYKSKSKKFIEFLIANGAGLNIQDDYGWTPLIEAIVQGNKVGVEVLVSKGADINAKNNKGDNALHIAVQCSSCDIIKILLLNQEAQVNAKNKAGWTPLHFAAHTGRRDVAEILLRNGAEINAKNKFNQTPLRTAYGNGKSKTVELLRSYGGV